MIGNVNQLDSRSEPKKNMVNLILGSSSQFRKQVFQSWFPNTQISTLSPEIDEKAIRIDNPEKLVIAIANAKAGLHPFNILIKS